MRICKQNCGKFTFDAILKANRLYSAIKNVSMQEKTCYLQNYFFLSKKMCIFAAN